MVEQQGTHDLLKAEIGDEFEPVEFTITEEMADRVAWANDNYHPWYMEDSPFGGRIASPILLINYAGTQFSSYYYRPPGGGLHTRQEFEFINPLKIGKKIKMSGKLAGRYSRRGRDYFVTEHLAVDEDGLEIVLQRRTTGSPAVARREG